MPQGYPALACAASTGSTATQMHHRLLCSCPHHNGLFSQRIPLAAIYRKERHVIVAANRQGGDARDGDPARRDFYSRSRKGKAYEKKNRRRGRPAHTRSPDDTPLRDGNRDRLMGLLTERAVKTLLFYLMETNLNLHYWLSAFLAAHPIPREGSWDDVCGETFLRTLLGMPVQEAKYSVGRTQMYDTVKGMGVDPRSLAQRIMDIRRQLAIEFVIDLNEVPEENLLLLRESLSSSLEKLLSLPMTEGDDPGQAARP